MTEAMNYAMDLFLQGYTDQEIVDIMIEDGYTDYEIFLALGV